MTTDPLVATLFAIECLHHGPAIGLIAPRKGFAGLIGPGNHAATNESEVVVRVSPIEFERHSSLSIAAQSVRDILVGMGFERIPVRITGKAGLREAINQSYSDADCLSEAQVLEFDTRAMDFRS